MQVNKDEKVTQRDYIFNISDKVFGILYSYFESSKDGSLDILEICEIINEARKKYPDLHDINFIVQSKPYSYEVGRIINLLGFRGLIKLTLGRVSITSYGRERGKQYHQLYVSKK